MTQNKSLGHVLGASRVAAARRCASQNCGPPTAMSTTSSGRGRGRPSPRQQEERMRSRWACRPRVAPQPIAADVPRDMVIRWQEDD